MVNEERGATDGCAQGIERNALQEIIREVRAAIGHASAEADHYDRRAQELICDGMNKMGAAQRARRKATELTQALLRLEGRG